MKSKDVWSLILFIGGCELVGVSGSFLTSSSIPNWYATLQKPMLAPPNWIFGPVWTILYAMMGVAAYLIWRRLDSPIKSWNDKRKEGGASFLAMTKVWISRLNWRMARKGGADKKQVKEALIVFSVQLALNAIWSPLFFGLQNPFYALIDILLMIAAIIWTIILFFKISRPAAYLLLPYLGWVLFATYLNFMIWRLN